MADTEKLRLEDEELGAVVGGRIDTKDYVYETHVRSSTEFLKKVPVIPEVVGSWGIVPDGVKVRVRDRATIANYAGVPYLRCIVNIGGVVEGYLKEGDLAPESAE